MVSQNIPKPVNIYTFLCPHGLLCRLPPLSSRHACNHLWTQIRNFSQCAQVARIRPRTPRSTCCLVTVTMTNPSSQLTLSFHGSQHMAGQLVCPVKDRQHELCLELEIKFGSLDCIGHKRNNNTFR